jgi:hypothetical protein
MRILWFISAFFIILTSCNNFICRKAQPLDTLNQKVISGYFDTLNVRKFKTRINFKTTEMTGILIIKKLNDNIMAGSFINEFGIKGFDFTINANHARLGYIFTKLNKWYIRRTLETDLHFMFSKPELNATCSINDTSVYVATIKPSLHYVYYFGKSTGNERVDMYKGAHKISSMYKYNDEFPGVLLKMAHTNGSLRYELSEIKN